MEKILTPLEGVFLVKPRVFGDQRGFFLESYNQRALADLGIQATFVQDSHSFPRPAPRPKYSVLSPSSLTRYGIRMPSWQDALERYLNEREVQSRAS
jgi:hypothetical protein